MAYFLQQLVNGIALGSIYGLIAIGYTMVYGIVGMINFAHGDIFMVGAFIALIAFLLIMSLGVTMIPLALVLVLIIAMVLTAMWGWTVERMPSVDRAILRLGAYEVLYAEDVPEGVAIAEAVELAKSLSTDESPKFVNGLLARLAEVKPTLA